MIYEMKTMEPLLLICFILGLITVVLLCIFILYHMIKNIIHHIKLYYLSSSEEFLQMKEMFNEIFSRQSENEKENHVSKKTYNLQKKSKGK